MLRAALKLPKFTIEVHLNKCLDTHNAACGIETANPRLCLFSRKVSTHTMLRAALKLLQTVEIREDVDVSTHTMLRAALKHCGIVGQNHKDVSRHTQCYVRH